MSLYKGTILQYLRRYIKDLQADQLESYILAGECTLHAIELDPAAVVEWVADVLPYTLEIERVFCSKVEIKIPWAQLKSKPLLVNVHEMEIVATVHDFREQEWNKDVAASQRNKLIASRISDIHSHKKINYDKFLRQFELGWTDYVFSGAQVRVEFCKFNLKSRSVTRLPRQPAADLSTSHTCDSGETSYKEISAPKTAFTIIFEGMLIAPCHSSEDAANEWNVSYVDSPDLVFQLDSEKKLLQLSRLMTVKSFLVYSGDSDKLLIDNKNIGSGFRARLTSDYHCVNLSKSGRHLKLAMSAFPAFSKTSLWLDKLGLCGECNCAIASFYSLMQDLMASVMVPAEGLLPENREHNVHYTFGEREILNCVSAKELEKLKAKEKVVNVSAEVSEVEQRHSVPELPELRSKSSGGRNRKKTTKNVVRGGPSNSSADIKRLFYGIAQEVNKVSESAQVHTDKLVSQSRRFFGHFKLGRSKRTVSNDTSPSGTVHSPSEEPATPPERRGSLDSISQDENFLDGEKFLDAVSESDDELDSNGGNSNSLTSNMGTSSQDSAAIGVWADSVRAGGVDGEFQVTQLGILEKLCCRSFFHIHVNELSVDSGSKVKVTFRQLDVSTEAFTPLSLDQLTVLSAFSASPELFFHQAKLVSANVLCPLEPVHATTAMTANVMTVTVDKEVVLKFGGGLTTTSSSPTVGVSAIGSSTNAKGLSLKWKSRSHVPPRVIAGSANEIEPVRFRPMEGCLHKVWAVFGALAPFSDLVNQSFSSCGDFPDTALDQALQIRLFLRDVDISSGAAWRCNLPSAVVSKVLAAGSSKYVDLLSGFQALSGIPECHFARSSVEGVGSASPTSSGFPNDGSFCSCICGQERTSWSWLLPSLEQVPKRIIFPGRVLSTYGVVAERTWKRLDASELNQYVYVPMTEYNNLVEIKLKIAEQEFQIQQLQDQYRIASDELTRKNIALKEKWAAEAAVMASKETVLNILTEKVCVLEKMVKDFTDEQSANAKQIQIVRSTCTSQLAETRKELIEETQRWKHKMSENDAVQAALWDDLRRKESEINYLKNQRDFLLGMFAKAEP